jgi:hypothetical protein
MPSPKPNSHNSLNQEFTSAAVLEELVVIKQLLVILLTKLGSDSGEIGDALGLEPRRVREWISFNGIMQIQNKTDKKPDKAKKRASKRAEQDKETKLLEEADKE